MKYFLLLVCVALSACSDKKESRELQVPATPEAPKLLLWGAKYDDHQLKIDDLVLDNVYTLSKSTNGKYVAYAQMVDGWPEVFFHDVEKRTTTKLTDNERIEFEVAVNDLGNVAYALEQDSSRESLLYIDSEQIELPIGMYKNLNLTDEQLIFNGYDSATEQNTIWTYDLGSKSLTSFNIDVFPNKIVWHQEQLMLDGVENASYTNQVYVVDIDQESLELQQPGAGSCYYIAQDVKCYSDNQTEEMLFDIALNELRENDPLAALSCGTGFDGRLSWTVSYRLHSLIKLLDLKELKPDLFQDVLYPIENVLTKSVDCLLTNVGQYEAQGHPFWPTRKYSIDAAHVLSLAINDAMVMYPLVLAANKKRLTEEQLQKVTTLAQQFYDFHEPQFDNELSLYRFEYDIPYALDGIPLPWNMSAIMALTYLETFELTGEERYKSRAIILAQSFIQSWVPQNDGRLLWHYWPDMFYQGWQQEDLVSVHTPVRNPSEDVRFEDLGHAGLNVWFINKVAEQYQSEVTGINNYKQALSETLSSVNHEGEFSRFMNHLGSTQHVSRNYMPKLGWLDIGNCATNKEVAKGYLSRSAQFSQNKELNYITLLMNEKKNESSFNCFE